MDNIPPRPPDPPLLSTTGIMDYSEIVSRKRQISVIENESNPIKTIYCQTSFR